MNVKSHTQSHLTENDLLIPANDNEPACAGSLAFDPAQFTDDLTDCGMSEEHRLEALNILWDMMVACADMGWGIEPTQTICAKLIESAFEESQDSANTLESVDKAVSENFAKAATHETVDKKGERL